MFCEEFDSSRNFAALFYLIYFGFLVFNERNEEKSLLGEMHNENPDFGSEISEKPYRLGKVIQTTTQDARKINFLNFF